MNSFHVRLHDEYTLAQRTHNLGKDVSDIFVLDIQADDEDEAKDKAIAAAWKFGIRPSDTVFTRCEHCAPQNVTVEVFEFSSVLWNIAHNLRRPSWDKYARFIDGSNL